MSGRVFFVGGNWKCNGTTASVKTLVGELNALVGELPPSTELEAVVAPTALHLSGVQASIDARFGVAAQNFYTKTGAFTGEVAAEQLADAGVAWALVGHSERRDVFGESAAACADKAMAALAAGVKIIFCVGEQEADRDAGKTADVLAAQLAPLIERAADIDWAKVVLAYEPVWAIGTGKTATPEIAQETQAALRSHLAEKLGAETADALRILYGGSVKPANCRELAQCADVDGFLVGGASLSGELFGPILKAKAEQ